MWGISINTPSIHIHLDYTKRLQIIYFVDSLKKYQFDRLLAEQVFGHTFHETRAEGNLETAFEFLNPKESSGSSADLITCNSALGHWNGGWQMAQEFLSWMQGRQLRCDVVPWSCGEMAWFLKYNPTKKLFFLILPLGEVRQWEVMKEESLGAQTGFLVWMGEAKLDIFCWMHSFTWAPWLLCKCVAVFKHISFVYPFLGVFFDTMVKRGLSWFPSKMEGFHHRWDQWIHPRYSFNSGNFHWTTVMGGMVFLFEIASKIYIYSAVVVSSCAGGSRKCYFSTKPHLWQWD